MSQLTNRLAQLESTYRAMVCAVDNWSVDNTGENHIAFCHWLNKFHCVYDDWAEEYKAFKAEMLQYLEECSLN